MFNIHQRVRDDHPRLFFTTDSWPTVEQYAQKSESDYLHKLRADVDALLDTEPGHDDYGTEAANAAFLFYLTDDERYRDFSISLLKRSISFYHDCYEANEPVNWESDSRINAWAAYDWLFEYLPVDERERLGKSFLDATEQVQPTDKREQFEGENWSGTTSGFYGTRCLRWYAGLATLGENIDDERARHFVEAGYNDYTDLLAYRSNVAGDVGGTASATVAYALGHYPWAEFNFFYTVKSATGKSIAGDWPYVALLPVYYFWNRLPSAPDTGAREFGAGDAHHWTNEIRKVYRLHMHFTHILHFYGDTQPRAARFAKWLRERTPREFHPDRLAFPLARFFAHESRSDLDPEGPPSDIDDARLFRGMGQTFFRSGYGPDDTYALFTADGQISSHKHYDHNHFMIFKKGFLTVDSGARAYPSNHLSHYYCRTAAHNCMLIRMPGEEMPREYWGEPTPAAEEDDYPIPNDGGQREQLGSEVIAFETTPNYSYVAGDATDTYHEEKCNNAVRQFVYIPPDHFVIFDRVRATDREYEKTWLLHTAHEPTIEGDTVTAVHEDGCLFSQTLLPRDADITAVGGPDARFRVDGRNWSLPDSHERPEEHPLYGQWRVEVNPQTPAREDCFLHLLQASDRSDGEMVDAELLDRDNHVGVDFTSNGIQWIVLFSTAGDTSGHIKSIDPGSHNEIIVDQALAQSIQSQSPSFRSR